MSSSANGREFKFRLLAVLVGLIACGCDSSTRKEERAARELVKLIHTICREADGTVRPVEALSTMAAIVGERCIDAAGEFKVRENSFIPGQRVFSDKVNVLLCGDTPDLPLKAISSKSIFGILRDQLAGTKFEQQFPDYIEVLGGFAERIGKPEDWGKVPLSLAEEHLPRRLPLRVAYDCRSQVDDVLKAMSGDKNQCLRVSTKALAMLLIDLGDQVNRTVALQLAFETVNGMAKTVPMKVEAIDTPSEAIREAQHKVIRIERR